MKVDVQGALATLAGANLLEPGDREVAELLGRMDPDHGDVAGLGATLCRLALRAGNTRVELDDIDGSIAAEVPLGLAILAPTSALIAALQASPLVSGDGAATDPRAPLVLRGKNLWLQRLADAESRLASMLKALAVTPTKHDKRRLNALMPSLFPPALANAEQEAAVRAACARRLLIVAGGPGTGKTTTVVRVLAALADQAQASGRTLRALLVAPTGKAAARLAESVARQRDVLRGVGLTSDGVDTLLGTARTLHRALMPQQGWLTRFAYGPDHPFVEDVIVVDEASMIDLPLFLRVVEAVGPHARLILLGDPRQLAAVGAGAVLGELYGLPRGSGVGACVHELLKSHRFSADSAIGRAATAIRDRDVVGLERAWSPGEAWRFEPTNALSRDEGFLRRAVEGWAPVFDAVTPAEKLQAMERFRVLCALRAGPDGVEAVNAAIEARLVRAGKLRGTGPRVEGRPILITANDPRTHLSNGDVGLLLPGEGGHLYAWFDLGAEPRAVLASRLPPHEPAWAITVHKSQGSEHEAVLLGLGSRDSRLMVNEMLYTGLTRAKKRVEVYGPAAIVRAAVERSVLRRSGLGERLVAR